MSNTKLDLHGIKHAEVTHIVDSFLYEHMQRGTSGVTIITGYSSQMKTIVANICHEYGFTITETWGNGGSIEISMR